MELLFLGLKVNKFFISRVLLHYGLGILTTLDLLQLIFSFFFCKSHKNKWEEEKLDPVFPQFLSEKWKNWTWGNIFKILKF